MKIFRSNLDFTYKDKVIELSYNIRNTHWYQKFIIIVTIINIILALALYTNLAICYYRFTKNNIGPLFHLNHCN